jgi:hypothetical protein
MHPAANVVALMTVFLAVLASLPPRTLSQPALSITDFTIVGRLLTQQGQPVRGETVYCFLFVDGRSYAKLGMVGDRIAPVNPSSRTDDRGRFEIKVGSAFIPEHAGMTTRYTVGIYRDGKPVPIEVQGFPAVFDLELVAQARQRVDLGSVTIRRE